MVREGPGCYSAGQPTGYLHDVCLLQTILIFFYLFQVSYNSGVKADCGNELTPTLVKDPPTVKWNADASTFYTLAMVG